MYHIVFQKMNRQLISAGFIYNAKMLQVELKISRSRRNLELVHLHSIAEHLHCREPRMMMWFRSTADQKLRQNFHQQHLGHRRRAESLRLHVGHRRPLGRNLCSKTRSLRSMLASKRSLKLSKTRENSTSRTIALANSLSHSQIFLLQVPGLLAHCSLLTFALYVVISGMHDSPNSALAHFRHCLYLRQTESISSSGAPLPMLLIGLSLDERQWQP